MILKAKIKNINGHYQIVLANQINADLGLVKFDNSEVLVDVKKQDGTKSEKQFNALHLYFTFLARALNDAGFDMKKLIKTEIDIPWNIDTVKNYIWRPIQREVLQKESTKRLNKMEINQVLDVVDRMVGEKTGVHVEFPRK